MIVMGASAGGFDALARILAPLGRTYPLAIAIVQHRGLDDGEALAGVLQRSVALPIEDAEDKQPIAPGRVYLAPADYHLLVDGDHFALSVDSRVNSARPSIDVLFESAAASVRQRLVAVLLTGASTDGSRGAARVRQFGGQVVVQDPDEAEAKLMPRSALPYAHRVLRLEEIARHLQVIAADYLASGT